MKQVIAVVLAIWGLLFLAGPVHADLDDGLVAYYPFDGNADDESGNGNDGTVNGAVLTEDRFGNADSAYEFDGVDDEIQIQANSILYVNDDKIFSLSVWMKTTMTDYGKFFSNGDDSNFKNIYRLGIKKDTGQITATLKGNSASAGGYSVNVESQNAFNDDVWHHAVLVAYETTMDLYVDGVLEGSADISEVDMGSDQTNDFAIGSDTDDEAFFDGVIDDVRVYDRN